LNWDAVDRVVQDVLSTLTDRKLDREPQAVWKAGRTSARAFPLFSHRVFDHLDGDDYDPIVVGLTFTLGDGMVRVSGDISGDESGFVYFDEGCVIDSPQELCAVEDAARRVAERLAAQYGIVLEAIKNRHPCAIPE
jgi:hypothetical protein